MWYEKLLADGAVPDAVIRAGIRAQLAGKLKKETAGGVEGESARLGELMKLLKAGPIAVSTKEANEQHYELPSEFFVRVLGKRLKYSSGFWPEGVATLDASEEAMLALYTERARLADGQDVLELGCGWGSLSLYLAERYPASRITGVSNSAVQKRYIDGEIERRGLRNLRIVTADINAFEPGAVYDRVVSVEMFEHLRNYERLFAKIASWMKPDALLFTHIFTHDRLAYLFDSGDKGSWMARYFFTGGIMPSHELLTLFPKHLRIADKWKVDGKHYRKTWEGWLAKMDAQKEPILRLFRATYGEKEAGKWWFYWRIFFMACAELFGYRGGSEWYVSHYLFEKQPAGRTETAGAAWGAKTPETVAR